MDIYSGIESGIKGDWTGVGLAAVSTFLPQSVELGLKHGRRIDDLIPEFRTLLGERSSQFSDDELKYILQQREQALLNIAGRHTVSTPKRTELYENGELQGYLELGSPGTEGLTMNWVENLTKRRGKPVSPELYSGGIHQAQDLEYSGLESGHHLRDEKATRRNVNLDTFDGKVIGTGKADAQSFEEYIQGQVNYYKTQIERKHQMSPEELEIELERYEDVLRTNLKGRNEFSNTDEFKERVDKLDWPYETDVLLLTGSKVDYPLIRYFQI